MCQMCEEADRYMAELEAAASKAAAQGKDDKCSKAATRRDAAAATSGAR